MAILLLAPWLGTPLAIWASVPAHRGLRRRTIWFQDFCYQTDSVWTLPSLARLIRHTSPRAPNRDWFHDDLCKFVDLFPTEYCGSYSGIKRFCTDPQNHRWFEFHPLAPKSRLKGLEFAPRVKRPGTVHTRKEVNNRIQRTDFHRPYVRQDAPCLLWLNGALQRVSDLFQDFSHITHDTVTLRSAYFS